MVIQLWHVLVGVFIFAAALSTFVRWLARLHMRAAEREQERLNQLALAARQQRIDRENTLSRTATAVTNQTTKPQQRNEPTERQKTARRQQDALRQVYFEWLDFEGLRGKCWLSRKQHGGLAGIEDWINDDWQITVLILLYGLGHRTALNHAATTNLLCRTRQNVRTIEHHALLGIEAMLWNQANPLEKAVRFSKKHKVWLTLDEQQLASRWIRNRQGLFTTRPPENPHPQGLSDAGDNARQWLQGEAHLVWMRKQHWAANNLPAATQRQPGNAVAAVSLS